MELHNQNILFFTRTMQLGGTENVVLQLCEIFYPVVNKIVVCSCGGVHVKKLEEMGIKHYTIPDIEIKSPSTIISTIKIIEDIVKREKINIIHTHHRMAAFYVAIRKLYKKCYFVNTSHNTFSDKIYLTRFAYRNANLIACGDMVKKNLEDIYGLKNIEVIHNAVKPFHETISTDPLLEKLKKEKAFIVGNIGRLSKQKGMEYYIKAIPAVVKRYPSARFVMIGTGEDEDNLRVLSKRIGADRYLYYMGYRADIQNVMSQMDLIVLSSLWEGFPLTPIEASSVAKAVIGTNIDGTKEIIENMKSGILIEPKNSEMLAEKIIWIIEHPAEKKQMEYHAYLKYTKEFIFERFAELYSEYYRKMISC